MKIFFSMRTKFVILMVLAFAVALTAMTISTRSLYLEDKESYLYDDMLNSTLNDSQFIDSYIENKRILAKSIFSNSIIKKTKDSKAKLRFPKEFFVDNPNLIDFRFYRYGNKEFLLEDEVQNLAIDEIVADSKKLFASANKMQKFLFKVKEEKSSYDIISDKSGVVQLRIAYYDKNSRFLGLLRFAISVHFAKLNFGRSYSKVLMDAEGKVLYQSLNYLDERKAFNFGKEKELNKYLASQTLNNGVKALRLKEGKYLVAYKKFPETSLWYLTLFSEKHAFRTVEVLMVQTLRIAIFVFIGVAILIFLFSDSITRSIKDLTLATKDAIKGNYRQTIRVSTGDEVGLLVDSFNDMVTQVQKVTSKLKDANNTLEAKVQKRTADLKTSNDFINAMINSLNQGLFVFTRSGKILPIFTKACEGFFGEGFHLKNVKDLLPFNDPEESERLIKNMFEELIPFESLVGLAPQFVGMDEEKVDEMDFFYSTLEYFPMRNQDGHIQFVVVVATDRTNEFRAEQRSKKNKDYVERIFKMLQGKNSFLIFLSETSENLKLAKENIQKAQGDFDVALLMRIFHSIKGIAGQFAATELSKYVHNLETEVSEYEGKGKEEKSAYVEQLNQKIQEVEKLLLAVKEDAKEVIGPAILDGIPREEIPRTTLQSFRDVLVEGMQAAPDKVMHQYDLTFLKTPIKNYFEEYNPLIQELGQKLGKRIRPIRYENGEVLVDRVFYKPIFNNFVHIFRNIADHGIEGPDQRMEQGKDPSGSITIQFEVVRKKIEVRIQDDGAGIDPERIRQKMREKGYPEEVIAEPDDKVIAHIFDSNFSTKDEVSTVSGRGAGMDAVKDIIEKHGGAAIVASRVGEGTTFKFRLPLE